MIKINSLNIENTKKIKAVSMQLNDGLTVIGGDNGEGKTSVLDAIAYALGGEKHRPSNIKRDDSVIPPEISVTLSNGLQVTRKGKKSALTVTDPSGQKGGQRLLDSFVEQLALNLPRFLNSSSKEKAKVLLSTLGIDEKLLALESEINKIFEDRRMQGRIKDQKEKYANEMPYYSDVPEVPVNAAELIQRQQEIFKTNAENQRKRDNLENIKKQYSANEYEIDNLQKRLDILIADQKQLASDINTAESVTAGIVDISTEDLEKQLADIDNVNAQVRANLDKEKALEDAKEAEKIHSELTKQLENKRKEKMDLLNNADLPLEGLTVENGELLYNNQQWDCMSGSEQLRVATAIVRKLNPNCGFVLIDKLEQMDLKTLKEFGSWLEAEGLQAIATRVSRGGECSIIIEDGKAELLKGKPKFKAGSF